MFPLDLNLETEARKLSGIRVLVLSGHGQTSLDHFWKDIRTKTMFDTEKTNIGQF